MSKPYSVWILWGQAPEDGDSPIQYAFDTPEELKAFLMGVDEMDGWAGYDIRDNGEPYYSEENDRDKWDDDGVEYGDPRDAKADRLED